MFGRCIWLTPVSGKSHPWTRMVQRVCDAMGTAPHEPHLTVQTHVQNPAQQLRFWYSRGATDIETRLVGEVQAVSYRIIRPRFRTIFHALQVPLVATRTPPVPLLLEPHLSIAYRVGAHGFDESDLQTAEDLIFRGDAAWQPHSGPLELRSVDANSIDWVDWKMSAPYHHPPPNDE